MNYILLGVFLVLVSILPVSASNYTTLEEYAQSIDYSCTVDADCTVKDVHNCCGYYPACTNKRARVDASFVNRACLDEGGGSVCGFLMIEACMCEAGRCVARDRSQPDCTSLYWFDDTTKDCALKQFCGLYMYQGLNVFETKGACEAARALLPSFCGNGVCEAGESSNCPSCLNATPPCRAPCVVGSCPEDCNEKTFALSNGRKALVKVVPQTVSERAIERLGLLNFTIVLTEVGNDKVAYLAQSEKEGRMLGLFKVRGKVEVGVNAETGEVISVKKPWWSFMATGI